MGSFGVATTNLFDLLGGDENEDPQQLAKSAPVAAKKEAPKPTEVKQAAAPAKQQPVAGAAAQRPESGRPRGRGEGGRGEGGRGRGGFAGRGGRGRGEGRPYGERNVEDAPAEDGEVKKEDRGERERIGHGGRGRGGRGRGEYDGSRPPRREYERHDGTGRGHEAPKKGGAGKGNWGTDEDAINAQTEPKVEPSADEAAAAAAAAAGGDAATEPAGEEVAPKEEEKEMTLEEYEQQLAEKKAALNVTREVAAVDMAEFKGWKTYEKKEEEDVLGLELSKKKAAGDKAAVADKNKPKKEVKTLETGFRIESEEAPRAGGRGPRPGRGGRGPGRDGARPAGDSPRPLSSRGRGGRFGSSDRAAAGPAIAIDDARAFPSLIAA